jgi:hypothetical protein
MNAVGEQVGVWVGLMVDGCLQHSGSNLKWQLRH